MDLQIDTLTLTELRELKQNIEMAIRAAIREKNKAKTFVPAAGKVAAARIDLESEARAWMASRRK